MKNVVCLISGRGSNLEALLAAAKSEQWQEAIGARVAAVISNRAGAAGLAIAQAAGLPARVLAHQQFATRESFDIALASLIDEFDPALVVMAGFMGVLTGAFIDRFGGRLINIHPSFLPSFRGLATPRCALSA